MVVLGGMTFTVKWHTKNSDLLSLASR